VGEAVVRLPLTEAGQRTVAELTTRRRAAIADIVAAIPTGQRADLPAHLRGGRRRTARLRELVGGTSAAIFR
jgi:hypothetical protein